MEKKEQKKVSKWPLVGNPKIPEFLSTGIVNNQIAGSYIFLGPRDLGKTSVAKFFARILLCESVKKGDLVLPCDNCSSCRQMKTSGEEAGKDEDLSCVHSDFHLIKKEKDKKNISIEQVRDFIKILNLSSFLNSYKIGIIKNAESLSIEASNALLKTLEEPGKKVVVILIASSIEEIPQTIASRSQVLNFSPVSKESIYDYLVKSAGVNRSLAKNISHLSLGRPALALRFWEDRERYEDYLKKGEAFLNVLNEDLNSRIKTVSSFFGTGAGQEAVYSGVTLIEVWRGVARDLLLLNSGHKDLIQFEALKEKLEPFGKRLEAHNILKMIGVLQKSEHQIKSNVNPKLALENAVANI